MDKVTDHDRPQGGRRALEELEEALIQADCGLPTAIFLVDQLRGARSERITESEELKSVLVKKSPPCLRETLRPQDP